jgi:tRNA nucleotidyltransferase (CCA-adding enzyme)
MFGALCHDLGKPATTEMLEGRWRSYEHEAAGEEPTLRLLGRLGAPARLSRQVAMLVRCHLRPTQLVQQESSPRAYRRLAREAEVAGVSLRLLERVARADARGRDAGDGPPDFPQGDRFLEVADQLRVRDEAPRDVVLGRHLIARGFEPGPQFGAILRRCRDVQDETGWNDPERILDQALSES